MTILRYLLFFSTLFLLTGCEIVMDYHLDECDRSSLTVTDYGTQANHATAMHGPGNTDGLYPLPCTNFGGIVCNNAQFDAAQQYYMEAPDNPSISISKTGKATFSAWFKTTSTASQTILFKEGEYRLWMNNGILQFTIWNNLGVPLTNAIDRGTVVSDGQWHHVAVSINIPSFGTKNITGYIDKIAYLNVTPVYTGFPTTTTGKLYIGAMSLSGVLSDYFTGNIDEIHMVDDTSSSSDVATIYNAEVAHKTLNSSGSAVVRTCPCACVVPSNTTIPTWQATGDINSSTGAITVKWPTHLTNDIGLLFVESQGDADVSLSIPAGFTQVSGSPQTAFTPPACCSSTTYQTRLTVFWARATSSSMGVVTIADPGDHVVAQIITYRNVSTEANPFDITGGGVDTTSASCCSSTKTLTVSAVTTTTANTLIVQAASRENDSATASFGNTSYTNTALTSITERTDTGTTSGNGGGFAVWDGGKATTGTTGSTTVNSAPASDIPFLSIALKPGIAPTPPAAQCTSLGYDIFHPKSTGNKLQTRIVNQTFDANVSVVCLGSGDLPARQIKKIYAVEGSCPAATTGLPVLWSGASDINNTLQMITLTGINSTKAYSNVQLMIENNASQYDCSSDTFAIRPSAYSLTAPIGTINTSPFTLQLSAINAGGGYNGSANLTTALQTANAACKKSSKFLTSSIGTAEPFAATFVSDANTSSVKTTDIGPIYLNVKDTSWTTVDQPGDCIADSNTTTENAQGLVGCNIENNLTLNIVPNRFDVNATLLNSNGGAFTYLSTDLNMAARLDLNVSAKNSEGVTAENYSTGCYADTTILTLPHSAVPSPLTTISSLESTTSTATSTPIANTISIPFNASIFKDGNSTLSVKLNFDRNASKPVSPFDFNVSNVNIIDNKGISGTVTPTTKATFVYGRARAYDIKTDQSSNVPNPIELEIYSLTSSGYVNGMPQNVLHWYRNLNHNTLNEGRVIGGGFTLGISDNTQVNALATPINGIHPVTVSSTTDQTAHLDISPWLWYSPGMTYNYTTNCAQHPCFNYQYLGTVSSSINGINSGTFQGSDFTLTPAKTIIKKGVKVFR